MVERLEDRVVLSNVVTYHNDIASSGQNLAEVLLTRSNVNSTTFGKQYSYPVDGQVYAQPLVQTGVNITVGPNQGMHDVVFVATQHDSLYALDASSADPVLLWKRSFLDQGLPNATSVTSVPNGDTGTGDVTVEIGITGTPVIDTTTNTLYLVAKTKETVGGVDHYVQRLHAINISDGTDRVTPDLIGDTTNGNTNATSIYVYGNGDGSVTDPYTGTGKNVVQFNALREAQRGALTIVGGTIYIPWASHGDNGPYHGWVVGFDPGTLAVKGVFNTTPNGGLGGIWQAGGALSSDGTNLFFETGNGTFDGSNGNDTNSPRAGTLSGLDANGFPVNGNFGDSFVKVAVDPSTSMANQGQNGWGLKVVDYFTPFDQQYLNVRDLDVGSAADLVLPNSVGSVAHPHLLIGSGKEGIIYLIDRDNMGKYGGDDSVVQKVGGQLSGSLDTAAYFANQIYYVEGYGGTAKTFSIANAAISNAPTSRSADTFAFAGSTPSVSANGINDGIVWDIDRGTNQLRAYSSDSYATELYNSAQAAGNRDALGAAVKFQVPTIVNGRVYVGAGTGAPNNFLDVYGPIKPPNAAPNAPTDLSASAVSGSQIDLAWTPHDVSPNRADGFRIERSFDGLTGWAEVATAGAATTGYAVGGLNLSTTYFFRVRAFDVLGPSSYTNVSSATTTNQAPSLDYSAGFANLAAGALTFNGGSMLNGNQLQITDGGTGEARSIFSTASQPIRRFSTRFRFQLTAGDNTADGFAFVIQGNSPTALGGTGGDLGYGSILKSLAIKFDLYDNAGEGVNSTGLFTNGTSPMAPADDLTPSGVNLHSGDVFEAVLDYDGSGLTLTIVDTTTNATFMKTYANVDVPSLVGGGSAYIGFTGGTGGLGVDQEILTWTYTPIVATPPGIAANVRAVVNGYTAGSSSPVPLGAAVTWDAVSGATAYKIERKLGATGTYTQVGRVNVPATTYQDNGLATQSLYVYRVRATNATGDGAYSTEAQITTPALAPTPTMGVATSVTDTSVSISWQDNADNEDGFQIFRSVNSGQFSLLVSLPANTIAAPSNVAYIDRTVMPGSKYDYHVQAFNLAGYSDFAGITTHTLPSVPTNLGATLTGTTAASTSAVPLGATVTWSAATGAASYKIERKLGTAGTYAQVGQVDAPATSFHEDGLSPGSTYVYRVRASTPAVDGGYSSEFTLSTPAVPLAPTMGQALAVTTTTLNLSWQDNTNDEDGFQLFRSVNGGPFSFLATLPPNTLIAPSSISDSDAGLSPGTSYHYQLRAFNLAGFSSISTINADTPPDAIASLSATLTGTTATSTSAVPLGATVTWSAAAGAASYKIERKLGSDGTFAQISQVVAPLGVFHEDGLSPAATYIYRVHTSTPAVDGAYSPEVTITTPALPLSPTLGQASNVRPTTLSLSWQDNANNEDGFHVFRSVNGGPFKLLVTLPPSSISAPSYLGYFDSELTPKTRYDYLVEAFNLAGFSASTTIRAVTLPPVPGVATDLAVVPTGYTSNSTSSTPLGAILTWSAVPDATSYEIERKIGVAGTFFPIGHDQVSTSFQDTGLSANTTYVYRLRASNVAGRGGESPEVILTLPGIVLFATGGQATAESGHSVTLTWQDSSDNEDGFQIFRSENHGPFTLLTTLPPHTATAPSLVSYTDDSLKPGTRYDYRIDAFNVVGTSGYATATAFSSQAAPSQLAATPFGNQVVLTWNAPAGNVTSYEIFRSTASGAEGATPYRVGISTPTFTDGAVSPGQTYYYQVVALNDTKPSALSTEVAATVAGQVAQVDSIRINFTSSTTEVPAGFVNDLGQVYGPHANGLAFGWSQDNRVNARDRNSPSSPDEQHDSFIQIPSRRGHGVSWSIAVANGTYRVHLAAGDAKRAGGVFKINVNGVLAIHGKPTKSAHWVENTTTVVVTNGRISLTGARGAVQNKINFVEIIKS